MIEENTLFIARIKIQSGEEQYLTHRLVRHAKNEIDAASKVFEFFSEFCERDELRDDVFTEPRGYPAYQLEFISRVKGLSDIVTLLPEI